MIEQGFSHTDATVKAMIDFFAIRAKNLGPKEDKIKSSVAAKKPKDKKHTKKRKRADSDSSAVKSRK